MEQPFPARYWKKLDDGRIECHVCPRYCKIKSGQRGFCFVRGHENDQLVLHTYGRSSGFCIDPIEKKPLNHFLPGTSILSFGTAGCNLSCKFCQNWDISKSREMDRLMDKAMPKDIAQAATQYNCRSVAMTYNDPVIFLEYAVDTAIACREVSVKSVAVTAGYMAPEARKEFYQHLDAANVDLKAFTEEFYHSMTGSALATVLDTLVYLKEHTNVWFEITTLLIPDMNDSTSEIDEMTKWIYNNLGPDVPLHFTAFHPDWKVKDKSHTPTSTLTRARGIAQNNGLHFVYTGNVHDTDGGSTYCSHCHQLLIERDWYELGQWNIENGACKFCQTQLPGLFENQKGTWGSKRQPIHIN